MNALCAALLLLSLPQADEFPDRLARATGPAQLKELAEWCKKNALEAEEAKVRAILDKVTPPAKPAGDYRKREILRQQRAAARNAVADFMATRQQKAAGEVRKLLTWMKDKAYATAAAKEKVAALIGKIVEGDEAEKLASELAALPGAGDKRLARTFDTRYGLVTKEFTGRLFYAVDQCLKANEPGLAFQLYRELLRVDPQNKKARLQLGQRKVCEEWLRPFDYTQYRAGLAWDDTYGWVLRKERERYDGGEYYDLSTKKWEKLSVLNEKHAEVDDPWRLESEHFILVSTADLPLSVRVLKRLEAYFLQLFGEYDLFFAQGSSGRGAKLIFGVAPVRKKLTVTFYRSREQFQAHANPPTTWAAGFYSGSRGGSFFYGGKDRYSVGLLQHELTHHILGQFSSGGGAPSWLAEGAAVYPQYAYFDKDGVLELGPMSKNGRVMTYMRNLKGGKSEHSLKKMLTFRNGRDWDSGDISMNYRGAGAVVYFMMRFDGGRYRGDFLDLLRDAYSRSSRPIEDYFGMSADSLDFLMDRFYRDCRHD